MTIKVDQLYSRLNLISSATKPEVKKAYHKLSKVHHPDAGGDQDTFNLIKEAYEILMDDDLIAQIERGLDIGDLQSTSDRVNEIVEGVLLKIITGRFVGDHQDLIRIMDADLNETRMKTMDALETSENTLQSLQAIKDRILKGDILISTIIKEINYIESNIEKFNRNMKDLDSARSLIASFEYSYDKDTEEIEGYAREY